MANDEDKTLLMLWEHQAGIGPTLADGGGRLSRNHADRLAETEPCARITSSLLRAVPAAGIEDAHFSPCR